MKIRVLVVDDSAVMRAVLTEIINQAPDMEVVGTAPDAAVARQKVKETSPDVLTLDVEMPNMNGLEFLDKVMRLRPMPVIMISSQTAQGSETTLQALELGAVDYVAKPRGSLAGLPVSYAQEIHEKIRAAYGARLKVLRAAPAEPAPTAAARPAPAAATSAWGDRIVCIGASTGGTEAIKEVLCRLPANMPGIVMVQHMPEMFTASFARRLDSLARVRVKEAEQGERILSGHAYLAPGHSHLEIRRSGTGYVCELLQTPPYNRHRPAVDVLFNSAAQHARGSAVAALLTGMGKDGAQGMLAMRRAGAWTIGQDQESCVVYGMPREAAQIGACCEVAPLTQVAERIVAALQGGRRVAAHA
ncbi:MAG: chemotaxis response regulator protein-glutamate methylesterase [Methyloversatilis discipulorum]|uniref:protein-glutamate methylesterase/protein-glutamine glutaminase n=1 Tax=Methyloversatilis discipulorum TaxID=1119528 RepID=UPI0026EAEBBC|nr:chemotaxis response regulator protein-glutamate methylesterase [Methyloversatilis discipulorum]MBV5285908.1 chemotaxis response regulator protein-glutamate methylesterase [Methyloversatilis discipulorum]